MQSAKQCSIVEGEEVQEVKLLECLQLEHDKQDCLIIFRYWLLFIVLFAKKNYTNQIKSNYLNSHGEEAQEKPPGL